MSLHITGEDVCAGGSVENFGFKLLGHNMSLHVELFWWDEIVRPLLRGGQYWGAECFYI